MIRALRWAVAFLTIVRVAPRGEPRAGELARSAAFFPLVGAGVGAACWGVDLACADHFPSLVRGLLVVAAGGLFTRALHLDGLADTVDGLGSFRDRAGMLQVMRDPHLGAFGATALVIVILLQAACIAEVPAHARPGAIVAAAAASRLAMALAGRFFRYARESGTGSEFVGRVPTWAALVACVFAVGCVWGVDRLGGGAFSQLDSLATLGVGLGAGLAVAVFARIRLGGATGDTLGASGEIAQTAALVWAAARFS